MGSEMCIRDSPGTQTPPNTFSPSSSPAKTINGLTYIWNGVGWRTTVANGSGGGGASVTIGDTAPGNAGTGDLWWDSGAPASLFIYYQDSDSAQWVPATPQSDNWYVNGGDLVTSQSAIDLVLGGNITTAGSVSIGGTDAKNIISQYEVGTFTPVNRGSDNSNITGFTPSNCVYYRLGKQVWLYGQLTMQGSGNWGEGDSLSFDGIPFNASWGVGPANCIVQAATGPAEHSGVFVESYVTNSIGVVGRCMLNGRTVIVDGSVIYFSINYLTDAP